MRFEIDAIGLTAIILVLLAYVLFGCVFLVRKKPPHTEEARRARAATFGIVLQSVSFVLAWNPPRPRWWPFSPSRAGEVALAVTMRLYRGPMEKHHYEISLKAGDKKTLTRMETLPFEAPWSTQLLEVGKPTTWLPVLDLTGSANQELTNQLLEKSRRAADLMCIWQLSK